MAAPALPIFPHRPARRAAWLIAAVVVAGGAVSGVHRGMEGRPNWGSIQRETQYVWQHLQSAPATALFGYLPTAIFALWPFTTWTPQPAGLALFVLTNVVAAGGAAWLLARWWLPGGGPAASIVWPLLLVAANIAHVLSANQLTLWTLFLCVAGFTLLERSRPGIGGGLLGLAALVKTIPLLLVGYLVLRRKWRGLAGFAAAIVIADLVPCLLFFGWRGTIAEHRAWLRRAEWHSNRRLIDDPLLRVHRHGSNASLSVVLARWLRKPPGAARQVILEGEPPPEVVAARRATLGPDERLTVDPMNSSDQIWTERIVELAPLRIPRMHVADLSADVVWWIWAAIIASMLISLGVITFRAPDRAWPSLAALWMLAMLAPSPMLRHYYLALALPALVVIWRMMTRARARSNGWTVGGRLAAVACAGWLVGIACLGWGVPRWYGIHLGVLVLVAAATVWSIRAAARSEPEPARLASADQLC